jgi:hypothetical protein
LQDPSLTGHWNFDDLRNRLDFISDLSFMNNSGALKNKAAFVPENPELYTILDTLIVHSSNSATDSVQYAFIDMNNRVIDSIQLKVQNHQTLLPCDISALSYSVNRLRIRENMI